MFYVLSYFCVICNVCQFTISNFVLYSKKMKFSKREILELLLKSSEMDSVLTYILSKLGKNINDLDKENLDRLKLALSTLKAKRNIRFNAASRKTDRFLSKNKDWLDSEFVIPDFIPKKIQTSTGRRSLDYTEKSDRSKRREISAISSNNSHDPQRLILAARHAATVSKKNDLKTVLDDLSKSPSRANKIRKLMQTKETLIIKKTPLEAVIFLLDQSLSKETYNAIRRECKMSGADIWPAYNKIRETKSLLRPSKDTIIINEHVAQVSLQSLLNHTGKRIVEMQEEILFRIMDTSKLTEVELVLTCSWGFDGSSGHSRYKQRFKNNLDDNNFSDENIFATTLIPLQLTTKNGKIIWYNHASQSPRFCRPVKLHFIKESTEVILSQKTEISKQIDELKIFEMVLNTDRKVVIHFSLHLTLIDGKVLNVLTNTKSSQSCPICKSTPKNFNDPQNISGQTNKFSPDPNSLQYGISPLHAWIRSFECCLHIAYRINIKKWQVRTPEEKRMLAEQKLQIQKSLHDKLGLIVDKPKTGGNGNTNDGNTARRAFQNADIFANCLQIDSRLVHNLKIILVSLSCQLPIDVQKFEEFCISTAQLYISLYPWFPMPSTIHKMLIHSADIIRYSVLPIGMFGEEASESRNKDYKNFRLNHSRHFSRKTNLEDLFYRVMDSSDPIVSSMSMISRIRKRKRLPLPTEVTQLLLTDKQNSDGIKCGSESNDDDDDGEDDDSIDEEIVEEDIGFGTVNQLLDNIELSDEETFDD